MDLSFITTAGVLRLATGDLKGSEAVLVDAFSLDIRLGFGTKVDPALISEPVPRQVLGVCDQCQNVPA